MLFHQSELELKREIWISDGYKVYDFHLSPRFQIKVNPSIWHDKVKYEQNPRNLLDYFDQYLKNNLDYKWCFDHAEFKDIEPEVLWSLDEFDMEINK